MDKLRRGALGLGITLTPRQLAQFETYYCELIEWNQQINLTAITDYYDVQVKHFLDSLTAVLVWPASVDISEIRLIDIGSGAGVPGVALKIIFPRIRLILLEATAKKTAFLRYLIDRLSLNNTEVVTGRAEETAHDPRYREKFSLAISRAVAPMVVLVELALPFVAIGGTLIAQKKGDTDAEINLAGKAISLLGGRLRQAEEVTLPEFTDRRKLISVDKIMPTPPRYPRRPGIPAKRPLW